MRVVRDDDPAAAALAADGWAPVAESWGARLRVTPTVLGRCAAAVAAATDAGWEVLVLGPQDAEAVVALDAACAADYPDTVATRHDVPDAAALADDLRSGARWAYGATAADGRLDAVTVLYPSLGREAPMIETDFTVTRAAVRGRGLATGVKAAAVLDLAAQGHELFGTGGAGVNAASRRANGALGYVVTERWLHLRPAR